MGRRGQPSYKGEAVRDHSKAGTRVVIKTAELAHRLHTKWFVDIEGLGPCSEFVFYPAGVVVSIASVSAKSGIHRGR